MHFTIPSQKNKACSSKCPRKANMDETVKIYFKALLPRQKVDGPAVVDLPEDVVEVLAVPPEAVDVVVEALDAAEVSVKDVAAGLEKKEPSTLRRSCYARFGVILTCFGKLGSRFKPIRVARH